MNWPRSEPPPDFANWLESRARATASLLCVGLDPHPELLPAPTPSAARQFCLRLIEATAEAALAFKPNIAFFEAFGPEGLEVLQEVIRAVPRGIPVILDAKRGDIADSARAYAHAVFEQLGAHAVTLNPYLGRDAVEPFLLRPEAGAFILCKTSNPGADELQTVLCEGLTLYERVALRVGTWGFGPRVGLVVGATDPLALARVRALAPETWLLAPGIGAQGGDLESALLAGLRPDGLGMLIAVSRTLAAADDPKAEAQRLVRAIRAGQDAREQRTKEAVAPLPASGWLGNLLHENGCVQFGDFVLKSGRHSPIYFDLRRLASHPSALARAAASYLPLLRPLRFDRLAGLPYAALPISTAIALQGNWPLIYPRREPKSYGTRAEIEGEFHPGETAVMIDDVATTGGAKLEALEKLRAAGLVVRDVVVLVDREGGAREALAEHGLRLHAVARMSELVAFWEAQGKITPEQAAAALGGGGNPTARGA